ncbi:mechanosensitive ion channel protein MscS [Pandoraea pnomenusa]|jgi:small-conductance mechanosensitive channel|uniref:Small-conductance mechanosensitive channel n=1 Tax=Pandoraea pnomenusa TaxID=93220 RepID=A0A378YM66_9BURK|nr:mechanosensitive ion channel domain-containing protein [Pandoraea pnomenusa]AHB04347.1 mechanosensitive ion channel protein MscS [Pandoraea pnomenusa 3kgm]AHN76364.1 mechanosensitive ion channel protein MscS [Pandoraea pnomenusa]AIU27009.1 mechanosensitive ion channel protein MscS [Pandoraea pnomenusa]ANC44218.1 mechanosensitive ion channel protein MscS [Pandoraea pnomenusa]SUA77863.1 Small-conductance mechanosensitive channel [Pandoraea pnomenusa]
MTDVTTPLASIDAVMGFLAANAVRYGLSLVQAILILLIGFWIAKRLSRVVHTTLNRSPHFDATLKPLIESVVLWSVRLITIIAVLAQFGVQTASIIAVLGAAGLAIGLALQGTLQNIAAGTMLLVLRPFRNGDYITAGSAVAGTVEEIGLFTTTLTNADGIYVCVPNNQIWGQPITNFSRNATRRMEITVGIGLSDDLDAAMQALRNHVGNDKRVLKAPAPEIMVKQVSDSAIIVNVRVWASLGDYWGLYWDLQRGVKETVERAGCSLPYPTRTIVQVPAPAVADAAQPRH